MSAATKSHERPDGIPQDVWDAAIEAWPIWSVGGVHPAAEPIARAILAERERCAQAALGPNYPAYADEGSLIEQKQGEVPKPVSPYDRGRYDAFVAIREDR